MLVTLGTLRHQLAVDYDLQANVRRFFRRLARQQGLALLDPRRTFDRLYAGDRPDPARARVPGVPRGPATGHHRGDQHAVRLSATGSGGSKPRLIGFGTAVLVVGGLLYLVLVFPDDTRRIMPARGGLHLAPPRPAGGPPRPDRQPHPEHAQHGSED